MAVHRRPGEVPTKKTSSSRTLQVATAGGWKTSSLAKFSASEWLIINADECRKYVVSIRSSTCTKYKNVEGSTRLQHSAPLEHAATSACNK